MTRLRGSTAIFVLGVLLAQAAWMLAVPPFRGSDEFDHVFRAAGVASGQWRLSEPPEDGRGLLVEVPVGLAEAARGQCESLPYTDPDNCVPVAVDASGHAQIATAAAGYNPVFYWIVGKAGTPFEGAASLYAMRLAGAFLCLVGMTAAFVALRSWSVPGGRWWQLGLLAALTPTVVYATTVAAPNGIEMIAGLCLWVSLLGLGVVPEDSQRERWLLTLAIVVTPILISVRTLGPVWFVMIVGLTSLFHGPSAIRRLVQRQRPLVIAGAVAAILTVSASVWWVSGSNGYAGEAGSDADASVGRIFELPKWTLQMIGAFPYRDQPAPLWTYPLVLVVIASLLLLALRASRGLGRWTLVTAVLLTLGVPMLLTWITLEERGGHWQGRYVLPFAVGILPLAGCLLDGAGWGLVEGPRLRALAWCMLAAANIGAVLMVVRAELDRSVSTSDPGWIQPPALLVAGLMLAAWICLGTGLLRARDD